MIKPELNKRKFGYSQHRKLESLLRRKILDSGLHPHEAKTDRAMSDPEELIGRYAQSVFLQS